MMTADHVAPTTTTGNADKLVARVVAAASSSKKPKLDVESRMESNLEPDLVDEPPRVESNKSSGTNKGKGKEIEKDTKATPARQGSAFDDEEPPSLLEETSPPARAPVIKSKA